MTSIKYVHHNSETIKGKSAQDEMIETGAIQVDILTRCPNWSA